MKHNIRQRVINQYGLPVVKIETVIGELGSGMLDKNGKEIFEGDKLKYPELGGDRIGVVIFNGNFMVDDLFVSATAACDVEVIGHVDD